MKEGQQVSLRRLPESPSYQALVSAIKGRTLELTLLELHSKEGAAELAVGVPVEVNAADSIWLGVVEHLLNERIWLNVEHFLDRDALRRVQEAWRE